MKLTLGLTVFAFTVSAASLCIAQSLPPVRQLGPVTAVAKEPLGAVSTVRHLPDGHVLVNDILGRRIVMFDSTLSTVTVIADTTSATAGAYGGLALDAVDRPERKNYACHVSSARAGCRLSCRWTVWQSGL